MIATAYIGLGSNLDNPAQQLRSAIAAIAQLADCELTATAHWYQSAAVGPGVQPDYINTVIVIATSLSPLHLLQRLQAIEADHGRERTVRWGPRSLDLDLLLYDNYRLDTPELTLPHPRLSERNFVLFPLADIAPTLLLPNGISVLELLANCPSNGIVRLSTGASDG
ncbi:MAG: 2-amino-4-hydroxy-6-hydroxymethyldihydropteridine diphosphokinase [Porticoccaceae bacterium]